MEVNAKDQKFWENENVKKYITYVHENKKENLVCVAEASSTNNLEVHKKNQQLMDNENVKDHVASVHENENDNSGWINQLASPASSLDLDLGLEVHERYDLWKKILKPYVAV